ncbi:hypothetical protein M406DRAFT_348970 [Cryphonectria parasitica EP155]|uniref:Uncharacterized protein n=1 Tax=Cryphonectria parasitica (strain ATCC 38755 / EP155) TaxID=660469 RepID=A0A9P5CT49_CRYP1|nr:uncharacterized protein M406DRAFT_348970 [Cryphonectria parasitica EP155]KAF3769953.1 hypothetical protein M406DRAFT_348970 [Cryphonectria parasitica EP155]
MAKEKKAAVDLQKMINETRDRKKAQDTADKIFGKKAAPTAPKKANGASGPVSTRAGVNKRVVSSKAVAKPSSLAARTSGRGGAASTRPKPNLRANRNAQSLANALFRENQNPGTAQVSIVNIRKANGPRRGGLQVAGAAARAGPRPATGLTIKGLAGPHVVEVRGFAPGTTAADVEQATRNQGIAVHSCQLIRTSPTVDADLTCQYRHQMATSHSCPRTTVFLWTDRWGLNRWQWMMAAMEACTAISSWDLPATQIAVGEDEDSEAVEEATTARSDMMHTTT